MQTEFLKNHYRQKNKYTQLYDLSLITSAPTSMTIESTIFNTRTILKLMKYSIICLPAMSPKLVHIVQKLI